MLLTPKNNTTKAYDGATLSTIQHPIEATPQSDFYGGAGTKPQLLQDQQVSKNTINSFN